jgi:hypothetical protein
MGLWNTNLLVPSGQRDERPAKAQALVAGQSAGKEGRNRRGLSSSYGRAELGGARLSPSRSFSGAIETMPRRFQSRRNGRQNVRRNQVRQEDTPKTRTMRSSRRRGHPTLNLIGLPVQVSVPKLSNLRFRYCSQWDEGLAAKLGSSLLRLGICRAEDWNGSAVDFVERGFTRFCNDNGAAIVKRFWEGSLQILDDIFEMTEQERQQLGGDMDGSPELLFLIGTFWSSASVPLGATLSKLQREHPLLPASFYSVFTHSLGKWMHVYQYSDALDLAEMNMIDRNEEDLKNTIYPEVAKTVPDCLRHHLKMPAGRATCFLREIQPRLRGTARQLVAHLLELHEHARGYSLPEPYKLLRRFPSLEDHLDSTDGICPGCLVNWYEGDPINACYDEDAIYAGQNGPLTPSIMLPIRINRPTNEIDRQVKRIFDYAGAMFRSLSTAAKIIQIIRDIYHEDLRKHRLKSGLQPEPSPAGVWEQQL